jgi:hypothetical protein
VEKRLQVKFSKVGQLGSLLSLVLGLPRRSNPDDAFRPRTSYNDRMRPGIPRLKQDLPRFLVGEDLPLYPLERIIDRLGVTA